MKSAGMMYGKACMTLNVPENMTSLGCSAARMTKASITVLADNSTITKYNIIVSTPTPATYFLALLSFSQPVTNASVTFTSVS